MVGLTLDQVFGNTHPLHRMMAETLSHGEGIFHSELELKRGEANLWLMASTSLLAGGEGRRIGAMVVFQDITEIKALEEKLRHADRPAALGTLSAGLAHEIKNPLSAIKTFVQLLPKKLENRSFGEKFNITVPREIDRINLLVEDLLELTRRRTRPMVNLDVNRLILQVIDLHGEEMEKKQIIFKDHLDGTSPPIQGDSEKLYRAFSNLVINAIQAMPNGGLLTISSEQEPSSSKDKGVGLGMALTHKIIEDHRGTIEIRSEKGKGTTFVLGLPVVKV
jgi:two-component system sensor histidine kinase AtoS